MAQPGEMPERQPAILVVDDERPIVDLLTRYLGQHGLRALGAYSAEEARRMVSADASIAVMVSDVRMPGQSGLALAEELLRGRPGATALEVVLISGAGLEDAAASWPHQAFDVLRKPFRPRDVVAVARRALAAAEERRGRAATAPPRAAVLPASALAALRAPLLPILSAAEALATGAALDLAEARDQVQRIREGALHLLAALDAAEAEAAETAPLPQAASGGGRWA